MIALLGKGLNRGGWNAVEDILRQFSLQYTIIPDHLQITQKHSVVLSIGYQRIIDEKSLKKPKYGVIVFHSSDLPEGRGWAPLYYTITHGLDYLTQSMFYADTAVDNGPIIAKAKYKLNKFMSIADLRIIDDNLTLHLIRKYAEKLTKGKLSSKMQSESEASYWPRRYPSDSEISPNSRIIDVYDVMRALPSHIPPFFYIDGIRIDITLTIHHSFEFIMENVEVSDFSTEVL